MGLKMKRWIAFCLCVGISVSSFAAAKVPGVLPEDVIKAAEAGILKENQ